MLHVTRFVFRLVKNKSYKETIKDKFGKNLVLFSLSVFFSLFCCKFFVVNNFINISLPNCLCLKGVRLLTSMVGMI